MLGENVYIVTKDHEPFCVTFSEHKALAMFDSTVRSDAFRQASVLVTGAASNNTQVLLEAHR